MKKQNSEKVSFKCELKQVQRHYRNSTERENEKNVIVEFPIYLYRIGTVVRRGTPIKSTMEINLSSLTPLARLRDVRSRDRTFWCLALKRSGIDVHACLDSLRHTRWMFVPSSTRLFVVSRHKYPRPLGRRYTSRGTSTKRFRCANRRPSRKYDVANKVETTNSLFDRRLLQLWQDL